MGKERSSAIPIRSFPSGPDQTVHRFHKAFFRQGWYRSVFLGLLVSLLTIGLWRFDLFREFELRTLDARFRLRGPRPVTSPLAIVFIGDDSIEEFGRWPWSWDHHALLIDILHRAGAKLVLFDIFFADSPGGGEAQLLGAVAGNAGNVYFCSFFNDFDLPGPDGGTPFLTIPELVNPVPELFRSAAGTGHCNAFPDIDGNTRRVPVIVEERGAPVPAALLEVASDVLGFSLGDVRTSKAGAIAVETAAGDLLTIPVDEEGQTMVNFAGGLEAFPSYSFRQVLQADRFPDRSPIDLAEFRDRIVLVGVTFTGNTDLRPTPFSPAYPMIGIQANLLDNVLNGEFIRRPPRAASLLIWFALGGVAGAIAFTLRPLISLLAISVSVTGYVAGSIFAFSGWRLQLDLVGPATAMFFSYLLVTTIQYVETRKQKLRYLERMKYLGHLVESSNDAIVSFDLEGKVVSWNQGAQRIFGFREGEVLERDQTFLAVPDEREELTDLFRRLLRGEEVAIREMKFLKADGSAIHAEVSLSPIRDSRGETVGISLISQDLTEKKKMIEMLIQSEKLAEIGRMGSGIVHEIKNPLTSIMMMSSILTADEALPEKTHRYADIIEKESQRILRLSKNILSFARPQKAEMKDVDLNEILRDTLELVEYELKKAKARVQLNLAERLPFVPGDQEKLKQVFLNIIGNAGHAMKGGGVLTVETCAPGTACDPGRGGWSSAAVGETENARCATVVIADAGPGMPPEVVEKVFEPFFTTKGEGKGTGLGLYISRNIILEHHGRIEVRSREGEGTVFVIHLPAGR